MDSTLNMTTLLIKLYTCSKFFSQITKRYKMFFGRFVQGTFSTLNSSFFVFCFLQLNLIFKAVGLPFPKDNH